MIEEIETTKRSTWIFAGILVTLLICLMVTVSQISIEEPDCSYYKDWRIDSVPARCINYFLPNDTKG